MKKLLLLFVLLIFINGCKDDDETSIPDENPLVTQIITPEGGSIETDEGIRIIFPNGAVSVDTEVSIGFNGNEPTTFPNPNVSILGDVFSLKINTNSLNHPAILEIPKPTGYINIDKTTILISNGITYYPLQFTEENNKLVAELDYINYTEVYNDTISNRNSNDWISELFVYVILNAHTPPSNQLGLKKVDLDSNNNMTFSTVPTLNSNDKVLIMVHGWTSNPSTSWSSFLHKIKPLIETSGYTHYLTFGYYSGHAIDDNGNTLSEILQATMNGAKVDMVTHSMGGLVARSAIENHDCDGIVRNLITLGTPHKGSAAAVLRNFIGYIIGLFDVPNPAFYNINTQGFRDLNTPSTFLSNLNNNPAPNTTNYYPISGIYDNSHLNDFVVKKSSALGIQDQSLGRTFIVPINLLDKEIPHTNMTSDNAIILDVAGYLNLYNQTPTLTTTEITNITQITAIGGGNITDDGGSPIIAKGICWLQSPLPTLENSIDFTSNGVGQGVFTSSLINLTPSNTYYVRAYATNSAGTTYGNTVLFTADANLTLATLSTTTISDITETTATSGGNIVHDGGSLVIARGVCFSTSPNPTAADNPTSDGTNVGSFESSLTGLTGNTTYYVRAYATNSEGTAYGNEIEFTTLENTATLPTVTTTTITAITQTTATSGGNVTGDGGSSVTIKGVCWSTNPNPTTDDIITESGTGTGTFESLITGLTENTTYYVRAYATNSEGTAYSDNEEQFTTLASGNVPTVTTASVTNITETTATSGGNITDDGDNDITAKGVCWSISQNPTISDTHTSDGTGTTFFTSSITGLTDNTTYYVRAYATNAIGTAYGDEKEFVTLANVSIPTVTTSSIINITETTAMSGGNVTDESGSSVTVKGICYSTIPNPSLTSASTNITDDGTGIGNFTSNLTLSPGSVYFVRAYATNSIGTAYGNEIEFTADINIQTSSFTDSRDGISYNTVKINNQWWMAENLAYSGSGSSAYNDDESNVAIYGRLYTKNSSNSVCPDGWHLPSKNDFTQLFNYLGNNNGGKLKEIGTIHWSSPNTGATNISGFTALPAGIKGNSGVYSSLGDKAYFWTTSSSGSSSMRYYTDLSYGSSGIHGAYMSYHYSMSCRCIKD